MKDIHGERATPGRIFFVSPALHCVAMTALVYLRSSFGFTLFRPRSIFFALSVATVILLYIAWHEPEYWHEYRTACFFAAGALALYWLHFTTAIIREYGKCAERDDYSGTPHLRRLTKAIGFPQAVSEPIIHLWIEPAFVLAGAAWLRFGFGETHLSTWLLYVAPCMLAKEALNYWTEIRREKIAKDVTIEAEERGQALAGEAFTPEAPQATRIAAQKIKRKPSPYSEKQKERKYADILGITEPYEIGDAEQRYSDLIRDCRSGSSGGDAAESNRLATALHEAIEFFRQKLGG